MRKKKNKRHPTLLEVAHETAKGMYRANIINATTMRKFDEACVPKVVAFSPSQIKRIRLDANVSQPIFAKFLNTSTSTIKQWEQGEKHPSGTSLKLLNLVAEKGFAILMSNEERGG